MQFAWLLVVVAVAVSGPAPAVGQCKTPWQDCGSTHVKINGVVVENCCAAPCQIHLGGNTSFSFTFTPDQTYSDLTQSVCGLIGSSCIPFPNEKFGDMCNCPGCKLKTKCPFAADKIENITVPVPVSADFPKIQTIAKWQIFDSKKTQIGCFEVPVQTA